MLLKTLKWDGKVEIENTVYPNISDALLSASSANHTITGVILRSAKESVPERARQSLSTDSNQYRITVKAYMTKKSSADFNFMKQWNNDNPMPLRTMVGEKVKETAGMVYMKLHGDITAKMTYFCMKCGKPITNPVSQFFGMGPECGGHNYVNPFGSDEELKDAVENYRKEYLQKIVWEGWIIKSAITEEELI